jgi:nitrogen fixation/metabolism regulation signal transduction histidine kinase
MLRPRFELRLLLDGALLLLPGAIVIVLLLLLEPARREALALPAVVLAVLASVLLLDRLRRRAIYPLYTLANLLEALREGDYSLRGARARRGDAVGEVILEVNALASTLREQRLRGEEASALLAKIIEAIDIAIFSFDADGRLQLVNAAGHRLLGRRAAIEETAAELGLADCLTFSGPVVQQRRFAGGEGRFETRRFEFRAAGRPQTLLVISDLSRALRDEEREAWLRLIRVLGHELNNSLAPIRSMTGTLVRVLASDPLPADWRDDVNSGLRVIGDRSEALNRFMLGYTALARLPLPTRRAVDLMSLLRRVVALEQRVPVALRAGEPVPLQVDPDQIEQALINLLRNAAEASLPEHGAVEVLVEAGPGEVAVVILDEGLGLAPTENLFVPFFTTKPGGSGIGLALARQIVEGHGGRVDLTNRTDRRGCRAELRLPLGALDSAG